MASKFRKFATAVESIRTEQIFLATAKEQEQLALDLNRLQLQAQHINSEEQSLGEYAKSNKKKGKKDLYLTGAFQESMFLNTKQIPIFIGAKDEKTPILKKIYGPILGLTKENQDSFGNEVKEIYVTKVHKEIEVLAEKILH